MDIQKNQIAERIRTVLNQREGVALLIATPEKSFFTVYQFDNESFDQNELVQQFLFDVVQFLAESQMMTDSTNKHFIGAID